MHQKQLVNAYGWTCYQFPSPTNTCKDNSWSVFPWVVLRDLHEIATLVGNNTYNYLCTVYKHSLCFYVSVPKCVLMAKWLLEATKGNREQAISMCTLFIMSLWCYHFKCTNDFWLWRDHGSIWGMWHHHSDRIHVRHVTGIKNTWVYRPVWPHGSKLPNGTCKTRKGPEMSSYYQLAHCQFATIIMHQWIIESAASGSNAQGIRIVSWPHESTILQTPLSR